jgi:uncharacterized protein (TIGR02284 family)
MWLNRSSILATLKYSATLGPTSEVVSLHRAWTGIKSSITDMDDHAVLAECESGEDTAKRAYEAALKKDLPADVRTIVERQYQGVKENHDRIRDLRNAAA